MVDTTHPVLGRGVLSLLYIALTQNREKCLVDKVNAHCDAIF